MFMFHVDGPEVHATMFITCKDFFFSFEVGRKEISVLEVVTKLSLVVRQRLRKCNSSKKTTCAVVLVKINQFLFVIQHAITVNTAVTNDLHII